MSTPTSRAQPAGTQQAGTRPGGIQEVGTGAASGAKQAGTQPTVARHAGTQPADSHRAVTRQAGTQQASTGATSGDVFAIAAEVTDPEMPMLTLADLGVLREARTAADGTVSVTITPTYSGCPALDTMRADLRERLHAAGYARVEVTVVLHPPWTTDLITSEGRRKLAEAGVAPPGHIGERAAGPVPLTLHPPETAVACPRCESQDTAVVSRFGSTACTALRRCRACAEPFEHVKEI